MERRRGNRHRFEMPARIQAIGSQHLTDPVEGSTRDMNAGGMMIDVNRQLTPGTPVQLTLHMPAEVTGRAILLWVMCRVARTSSEGVGLSIERFKFVSAVADN